MRSVALGSLLALTMILTTTARADEIKLKNGDVLKDVEVLKKTEKRWRILHLDGNKSSIKATDVVSHVEKPTPRAEFEKRVAALGRKDLAGMIEVGRWGLDQGITLDAKKLLVKARKLDKDNAEVNELLGYKLGEDGRWRSGRSLEAYEKKQREAELKARGWVKVKGEYVSPSMAKRLNAGLVEHEGRWVTKADKKRLEKGEFWYANGWYTKDDRARLDKDELRENGKWMSIDDLNAAHRDVANPWVLESEHFVLQSNGKFKSAMRLLKQAEFLWKPVTTLLGEEPACWDRGTRIPIFMATSQKDYAAACNATNPGQRQDRYCSNLGGINVANQGVFTYWYSLDYTAQWVRHGGSQAILDRLYGYTKLKSNGYEAMGAYFEAFTGGDKYWPTSIHHEHLTNWMKSGKASPVAALNEIVLAPAPESSRVVESMFTRAGYAMHWIIENHRPVFDAWLADFTQGKSSHVELIEALKKAIGDETKMLETFRKDLAKMVGDWKSPPNLD
jgi:hypothetical protein